MLKLRLTRDVLVVRAIELRKGDRFKLNSSAFQVKDTIQNLDNGTVMLKVTNLGRLGRARQTVALVYDTKLKIVR